LRLMDNRCRASICHVRSMQTLEELRGVFDYDNPAPLTEKQAEKIFEIIGRSRRDAEAYLALYGSLLPDRGGEGQLVSYYETTLVYIDAVAAGFRGAEIAPDREVFDEPPMPDPEAR
ncbi:MAG: hypothetical protein II953_06005, partial [Clostridia bacterium]|nr:hypothetical protein [Clostridia bacterium]